MSKYDKLHSAFASARAKWGSEVDKAQRFAQSCRSSMIVYYGCPKDRVELLKAEEDRATKRHKVGPNLLRDEVGECWRFSIRLVVEKDSNPFNAMSFTTEFRLRIDADGYQIAAGEPQPWHQVDSASADSLNELFDSIYDWMIEYLNSDNALSGNGHTVIGFS